MNIILTGKVYARIIKKKLFKEVCVFEFNVKEFWIRATDIYTNNALCIYTNNGDKKEIRDRQKKSNFQ